MLFVMVLEKVTDKVLPKPKHFPYTPAYTYLNINISSVDSTVIRVSIC